MKTFVRGNKSISIPPVIKVSNNKARNKPKIVHVYPTGIFSTPVIEKRYIHQ
jgi:hypothetical protein